ncbi:MAG: SH3 domain-containing protein [Chloroflexi bacterium]|nr:SH3 domain-containing protein [Chloroflexota bacterium]
MSRKLNRVILLIWGLVIVIGAIGPASAQDEPPDFKMRVVVNSAFTHIEPSVESRRAASVFEEEILEAVGRNLDGTWFEVRRLGRFTNLGWLPADFTKWEFHPEDLPLTNLVTGQIGPIPLEADPGFAVYMQFGAMLRDAPTRRAGSLGSVPVFATVPVLARNLDGSWLKVNYRGYVGWIIAFVTRPIPDLMQIPVAPDAPPPDTPPVVIIPPEVQIAQIQRLREYVTPRHALSDGLVGFWLMVQRGEVMPCNPPESVTMYQYLRSDVRELPELDRYAPQLQEAISYLNAALDPLQNCGIVSSIEAQSAYAASINARLLFVVILQQLDSLEQTLRE